MRRSCALEDAGYAAVRVTATEAGRAIPLGAFAHPAPRRLACRRPASECASSLTSDTHV
jgi:hypothetical protein